MNPHDNILPIIAVNPDGGLQQFLGTGAFLLPGPLLLTADHVIRDWPHGFAVLRMGDVDTLFPTVIVKRDPDRDLALLRVDGYAPPHPLELGSESDIQPNKLIVSLEYGPTVQGGGQIDLQPATRVGNITRFVDTRWKHGLAGQRALELSFPALRGASGAPVLLNDGAFKLLGVILANVDYHLLPTQIESVLRPDGQIEAEVRYMMPQGIAVNVERVREFLDARG